MNCERCGAAAEAEEMREHAGNHLCEDCYLDAVSTVKACDPWAVHLAKSDKLRAGVQLTPLQERLYDLVKENQEIPFPEAARRLGLAEDELRREFATLRHLELLRGGKRGEHIFMTLF